jgi:hypothetical protein
MSIVAKSSAFEPKKDMEEAEPVRVYALAVVGASEPVVEASFLFHPEAAPMAFGTIPTRNCWSSSHAGQSKWGTYAASVIMHIHF